MATNAERDLFAREILSDLGKQASSLPESEITGFLAMKGQTYSGALMVVGRAVNGWTDGILPRDLCAPGFIDCYATRVQKSVAGNGDCPMRWITDGWGAREGYNTKRSAFWRTIRTVVQDLNITNVEDAGWPSHLVWSNLYKVSPAHGGNPDSVLCDVQFPGCAKLFELELHTYKPSHILLLTGADWAAPFLERFNFRKALRLNNVKYVKSVGDLCGAHCVIAVHPQGKPREAWAHEVVAEFNRAKEIQCLKQQ